MARREQPTAFDQIIRTQSPAWPTIDHISDRPGHTTAMPASHPECSSRFTRTASALTFPEAHYQRRSAHPNEVGSVSHARLEGDIACEPRKRPRASRDKSLQGRKGVKRRTAVAVSPNDVPHSGPLESAAKASVAGVLSSKSNSSISAHDVGRGKSAAATLLLLRAEPAATVQQQA